MQSSFGLLHWLKVPFLYNLFKISKFEGMIIKTSASFPTGGTLLLVGRKL